jgi:hypothetical protein
MTETVRGDLLPAQNGEQALAEQAHAAHERIRRHVRQLRGLWVDLAAELHTFHRMKMWADLGHDSFEEYLAQPELELGRRWVYENIAIYEQLVLQWSVPPERLRAMQISKVREVLPAIRRGQVELEAGLSDVETLSRPDLEIRYRGLASSTPGRPDTSTRVETDREPAPMIGPSEQGAAEELRLEYPEPGASLRREEPVLVQCPHCGGRGQVPASTEGG